MKAIALALCIVLILSGCVSDSQPVSQRAPQNARKTAPDRVWKNGQEVVLTGTIWPSKGGTKYYIKGDHGDSAHLRSEAIAKLTRGTRIWIKGVVEYVHFPAPEDPDKYRGSMELPQTLCYISVSEFKVIRIP